MCWIIAAVLMFYGLKMSTDAFIITSGLFAIAGSINLLTRNNSKN